MTRVIKSEPHRVAEFPVHEWEIHTDVLECEFIAVIERVGALPILMSNGSRILSCGTAPRVIMDLFDPPDSIGCCIQKFVAATAPMPPEGLYLHCVCHFTDGVKHILCWIPSLEKARYVFAKVGTYPGPLFEFPAYTESAP